MPAVTSAYGGSLFSLGFRRERATPRDPEKAPSARGAGRGSLSPSFVKTPEGNPPESQWYSDSRRQRLNAGGQLPDRRSIESLDPGAAGKAARGMRGGSQ
jgi:hypothetical protein